MKMRKKPDVRREEIMREAVALAVSSGYLNFTASDLAFRAGVTRSAVHYHLGGMDRLRQAVVHRAVVDRVLPIIAQLVVARAPELSGVPADLQREAVAGLAP